MGEHEARFWIGVAVILFATLLIAAIVVTGVSLDSCIDHLGEARNSRGGNQ